jgi:4'-phosphopantetheinyl transferase
LIPPVLSPAGVHIVIAPLDVDDSRLAQLEGTLSSDELVRAGRFGLALQRRRFIAAHGLLRVLLGLYVDAPPSSIRLAAGPAGKPLISRGIHFNLSHSEGIAAYALAADREVGIDVERVRPIENLAAVMRSSFTARECAAVERLPAVEHDTAFCAQWTRKEAYVKARGVGLGQSLRGFGVETDAAGWGRMVPDGDAGRPARWSVRSFPPAPGYCGAVVVEGELDGGLTFGGVPEAAVEMVR